MTHRRVLTACLLLTAALYSPLAGAPFVFEDVHYLSSQPVWRVPGRALTTVSISSHPAAAHLTNVALHLVNGALVYRVALLVTSPAAAVCAAGVFLLHPLNSEAVSYVAARGDLLVTLFALVAAWSALTGRWLVCGAAVLGAGLSKEIGLVVVPLAVVTLAIFRQGLPQTRLVRDALLCGAGLVMGAAWLHVSSWIAMSAAGGGSVYPWMTFVQWQLGMLARLLTLAVWPIGFSIDHDALTLAGGWLALGGALIAASLCAAAWAWKRAPVLAWGLAWAVLTVAPRFLVPTIEFFHEYYLYAAMVGVSVLLGSGLAAIWPAPLLKESLA